MVVALALLLCSTRPLHAADFFLHVGETALLKAPPASTVRIGSRQIVKAIDEGSGVRLIGMKPGETTVVIGSAVHRVIVSSSDQKAFWFELQKWLKPRLGLRAEMRDGQIVVLGQLLRLEDWLALSDLAREKGARYRFEAKPIPSVAVEAIRLLEKKARQEKWPHFRLVDEPNLTARLPAGTASVQSSVARALAPYGIAVETDSSQVDIRPLIRTRVILAEVSKHFSQDLGIEWPNSHEAQILPRWQSPSEILIGLRALEARGLGQVLAAPTLTCRSGEEAQFHAGGEFPIKIFNRASHDVVWKKHGVILRVKPKADFKGAISLAIETEISLLDAANAVGGVPALKTNQVRSHFDVIGKKTIALSGLVRQDWGDHTSGLWGLSRLPILGRLFSSQNFLNHKSELVIFVTPEIVPVEAEDTIQMPEGWKNEPR